MRNDDYIGCDTVLNLGFCYNGDNDDGTGAPPTYGASPPAVGLDYFRGTVKKNTNDTLGLTSFTFFTNNTSAPPPCESDPNGEPIPAYHYSAGIEKRQNSIYGYYKNPT